ncbi:MAG: tetratricopeptide repeat protein [Bdellovibrionota bacterium]
MHLKKVSIVLILMTAGCAHLDSSLTGGANGTTNYVYGVDAQNRAPASMAAKDPVDGTTVDPVHIRAQADYYFATGEAFSLEGAHQKAIENFKLALVYDPDAVPVLMRISTEYLRAGLVSEAIQTAESIVKKQPTSAESRLLLGGLYSSVRLFPKAVEQYTKVMELDKKNREAPLYLGAVYSETKQPMKAIALFEKLLKDPDYPTPEQLHYYIGRVYSDMPGASAKAKSEASFKRAMALRPNYADALLSWTASKIGDKDKKEILKVLSDFQKKHGPNQKVAETLAQIYIQSEQFDEAFEQYEILESLSPDNLDAKMRMALILIEKKMYEPAITKLHEILAMAPDSDRVRFYLGAIYEERKDSKNAIENYKLVPAYSQYYSESVLHAGFLMHQEGKLDDALVYLGKALENEKMESPQVIALYSSILDEKGESAQALALLEKSVEKYPESYQIRFYLGALYDKSGAKEKTLVEMKKVIELDPNHAQALNYLAFTLVEMNKNFKDAERYAQRAVQLEPKDGYILDTYGWIQYKKGARDEALKYLEAAYKAQPEVSIIAEHLGDVYLSLAMSDKASQMYQKALEFEKDQLKISEIKTKLGQITRQKVEDRQPASVDTPN